MSKRVLLVVDMQQAIVDLNPYRYNEVEANIQSLISDFRSSGGSIIHIQHRGPEGSPFEINSKGWQITKNVSPAPGELIIEKRFNSSFRGTSLKEELDNLAAQELIIVGMQTQFCIDTTIRVAFEKGYKVFAPILTNTTIDSDKLSAHTIYEHHNSIFNRRFAEVLDLCEL